MPPPNRRRRQLVVSGGYAAYDSSLPAKTTAATPDKMIVAAHSGSGGYAEYIEQHPSRDAGEFGHNESRCSFAERRVGILRACGH